MSNEKKEQIEKHLLDAMKSLDAANAIIWDENEKVNNAQALSQLKGKIKTILNKDYDWCARNRTVSV